MVSKPYDCAQENLDSLYSGARCLWCKYPYKAIHRAGLCRSCYSIKTELRQKFRKYVVRKAKSKVPQDMFIAEYELSVAQLMATSAQLDGMQWGDLDKGGVSNLDLEHAFGQLSRRFLKKD